jgi:hypothetical protein
MNDLARATEFAAAEAGSVEQLASAESLVLLAATGIAVILAVILLLIDGSWARRSSALLDELRSRLEARDE